MIEHFCPDRIARLFDYEDTVAVGRKKAFEWVITLNLRIGDKVWLPELGWFEKYDERIQ